METGETKTLLTAIAEGGEKPWAVRCVLVGVLRLEGKQRERQKKRERKKEKAVCVFGKVQGFLSGIERERCERRHWDFGFGKAGEKPFSTFSWLAFFW